MNDEATGRGRICRRKGGGQEEEGQQQRGNTVRVWAFKIPWQLRSDTPISHSPSSTGVVSLSLSTGSGTGTGTEKEGGEIVPGRKKWERREKTMIKGIQ